MPLTGPDNPLRCHYFCYYLTITSAITTWVCDNDMFTIGDILTCSYGGLREGISDLHSLRALRGLRHGCFTRFPASGHRLGLLYIMISIPICSEQMQ